MTLTDSFNSALVAIAANKLRSALTMLGVVIGVGSVIAMIGIGEGTKKKSVENIQAMGTNMLTVMPNWRRMGMASSADTPTLYPDDVKKLLALPTVAAATGVVSQRAPVKYLNKSRSTSINGAQPIIQDIRNAHKMQEGTWYTAEDEKLGNRKIVLGYMVYDELFNGENAVGASVRVKNENFEVVGVIAYKGGSGMMNADDNCYIPLSTAMNRLMGKTKLDQIQIKATYADLMTLTQDQVETLLGAKRRNAAGEELFRVMNQGEWLEQLETQTRLLGFLLAGIASVSLLVGGIGIMNIMLVSVTERTREIGLRKAIGAKRPSILAQFLLESIVMCTLGGFIGIILGYTATRIVAVLLKVPPLISLQSIIMAFGFSALVGLFFGLYPAMRASRLQPIEALRHE